VPAGLVGVPLPSTSAGETRTIKVSLAQPPPGLALGAAAAVSIVGRVRWWLTARPDSRPAASASPAERPSLGTAAASQQSAAAKSTFPAWVVGKSA